MTDHPHNPDDPIPNPFDSDDAEAVHDPDWVEAIFIGRPGGPQSDRPPDPYDLGWLFLCWSWEGGYRDWKDSVRALARGLRGLERIGFIERRTLRRSGRPTHHGFVVTDQGRKAVVALSGDWIEGGR